MLSTSSSSSSSNTAAIAIPVAICGFIILLVAVVLLTRRARVYRRQRAELENIKKHVPPAMLATLRLSRLEYNFTNDLTHSQLKIL